MIDNDGIPPLPNYYPTEPSSIPRSTQATWLDRPSTPLVHADVFMRRRNFVTSDLHVLLVTTDKAERQRMKVELGGLHYSTTAVSSGKVAQAMLSERGGEFHLVMISAALNGEGLDCLGLLAWIRDVPALREVSLIVLGSFSVEPANAIALIKAGATDILTRPVAVEALMRLRHAVGTSQSLTQQRAHRREEGGARLVTQYIMRKEREGRAEGLPPSVLMGGAERRDGSEPPRPSVRSSALLGEVTVTVLLMQRESRKSAELPALLSECGYQVKVARTKHEVLKQLTSRHASWSLLCIDYGSEHAPTLHPGQADFGGQVAFVLREMASRQLLVPTVAFQEEATTDRVVRTMRAGLAELYLPPYTKPKLRGLLRYVLKPAELRELSEEAKALHAVQQSTSSYGGGGASGGGRHLANARLATLTSHRVQLELLGVELGGVDDDARTDAAALAEVNDDVGAPDALNDGSLLLPAEALGDCAWLTVDTTIPDVVLEEEPVGNGICCWLIDAVGADDPTLVAVPEKGVLLDVAGGFGDCVGEADDSGDTATAALGVKVALTRMLDVDSPDGLVVIEGEAAWLSVAACVAVPEVDDVERPEPETLCEGLEELPCDGVIVLVSPVVTDCEGVALPVAENDGVCDCVILLLGVELAVGETERVPVVLFD